VVYALPVLYMAATAVFNWTFGESARIDPSLSCTIFRVFFLCQVWMAIYCIIHVRSEPLLVRIALVAFAIEALLTAIGMTGPTPFTPCQISHLF
jgi:hypothetical protein